MAKTLSKTGIITNNIVEAFHVTQSIDAFSGTEAYDITLSGSLVLTGSLDVDGGITGSLLGTASFVDTSINTRNIIDKNYFKSDQPTVQTSDPKPIIAGVELSGGSGSIDLLQLGLTFSAQPELGKHIYINASAIENSSGEFTNSGSLMTLRTSPAPIGTLEVTSSNTTDHAAQVVGWGFDN